MKKKYISILCMLLLIFSVSSSVSAYTFSNLPNYSSYSYFIASSCPTGAVNAVINSFTPWNATTPSMTVTLASTSKSGFSFGIGNGINTIGSLLTNNDFAVYGGSGAIAMNVKALNSSGYIIESDIAINNIYTYGNGNSQSYYDYQGVFTHELGHTFGLGDIYTWSDPIQVIPTMYGLDKYSGTVTYYYLRTLEEDDKAGKAQVASLRGF